MFANWITACHPLVDGLSLDVSTVGRKQPARGLIQLQIKATVYITTSMGGHLNPSLFR